MALFLVQLADGDRYTLRNGVDTVVVSAEDATDAKAVAKAQFTGAAGNAAWDAATATALADVAANDANALVGWRFRVKILDSTPVVDVTVVGDATDDTLDEIGTALAVALNLESIIAGALYTAATQVLIIAAIADNLGDKMVEVEVTPPLVLDADGNQISQSEPIPGFVTVIVDEGIAGANLTVTFPADTFVVPAVLAAVSKT